jgi:hypothetical protein
LFTNLFQVTGQADKLSTTIHVPKPSPSQVIDYTHCCLLQVPLVSRMNLLRIFSYSSERKVGEIPNDLQELEPLHMTMSDDEYSRPSKKSRVSYGMFRCMVEALLVLSIVFLISFYELRNRGSDYLPTSVEPVPQMCECLL